ncbi:MAG TPA: hypothetical protein VGM88_18500 [Kofleriaceae bacterium]|jgi:hypothetical protein
MIAIEARRGVVIIAGLIGLWLGVRPTGTPPAAPALALTDSTVQAQEPQEPQVAHEAARRWTIEDIMAMKGRDRDFMEACIKGGGRACCGQGGCCSGKGQSWAEHEALIRRITVESP